MKIISKFLIFTVLMCAIFLFTTCNELGGTIIIKNNYTSDKTVTVYKDFSPSFSIFTYTEKYGPKNINTGGTVKFNVNRNAIYGIVWRDDSIDKYKSVYVS